ncbi:unnamed protein product [Clonostachys chloroleuca]|uniref:Uncharacterized protein n=1 Tax=Clonostachys chloroleuca TaxID=1926264 RepID=A0AA35QDC1_9HYPO|nr:unnamed protein product [Clonostachys chloroleuca]
MKSAVKYTIAATLAVGASAAAHQHPGHQLYHAKKDIGSPVKREASVVQVLVEPTETVYLLGGNEIDETKAKQGIADGKFIVVGESNPTAAPITIAEQPTVSAAAKGGLFVEEQSSSSSSSSSSSVAPQPTTTTVIQSLTTSSAAPASTSSASSSPSTGTGLTKTFKSKSVSCDSFPSDYGAIALPWLGLDDWSGIQKLKKYNPSQIYNLVTGVKGEKCESGGLCTYACPPGYFSTQYPLEDQQSDGTSIGGLFCNSDGKLVLTNPDIDVLCKAGEGGISVKNELSKGVAVCQTMYPGTENMVIPSYAAAGGTVELLNPKQDFFKWGGAKTSAQFYVNKAGYTVEESCQWQPEQDPTGAGNWAPIVIGVGKDGDNTYISILPNAPTSTAVLGFNIEITGKGLIGSCKYENGIFSNGDPKGCTVTVPSGGSAVYRFY